MTRPLQFSLRALFAAIAAAALAVSLWRSRGEEDSRRIPVSQLGTSHVLVGKTHVPLGEVTTLKGLVINGPSKGYDDGPNIRVQFINGRATQEIIHLQLAPYLGHLDLTTGRTYELKGFESGHFVGNPSGGELFSLESEGEGDSALYTSDLAIPFAQGSSFGLHLQYMVGSAKEIPAIRFAPKDFVDRQAVIEGTAEDDSGKAYLVGNDWRLVVDAASAWPSTMLAKEVAVLSTIHRTDDDQVFRAEQPQSSQINLVNQVGQVVRLRGQAHSMNDEWWLDYRGTRVYLGKRQQLRAMKFGPDYGPAVISGTLIREPDPESERADATEKTQPAERFAMQVQSWQPIESLFSPELGRD